MKYRVFASIVLTLVLFFSVSSAVFAQDSNYGLDATAGAAGIPTSKGITTILGDVVGAGLSLVSVLFFALMLYAGIKWMLSRGDDAEATKALDTIVAAIIGLVVVLASYALTTFVFKSVGGGEGVGGASTKPKAIDVPKVPAPTIGKCVQKAGIVATCGGLSPGESCDNNELCTYNLNTCFPLISAEDCAVSTKKVDCEKQGAVGACTWNP